MNKLSRIILILIFTSVVGAQSVTIMPYHLPINYKDSGVRENSSLTGVYGAFQSDLNNKFELAFDYSYFNYISNFKIKQFDFTFAYTNESSPEEKFRLGGHYIVSDDVLTDQSYVLFAGVSKYRFRSWDANLDVYYSNYGDYSSKFNAIQLSPTFGLTFPFDRTQGVYFNTQVYFIRLSEKIILDKKNYFSVKETITYYNNNFSVSAYALFGEQRFAVRQNGFLVYNSADLMKTGFGGSLTYSFTQNIFLKGGVEYDKFDEEAYGTSATSTKFIILAGFNF
ncbi:hypothetical protein ASZ90_004165 [hydrocarbon metagenome]|uniref:Uncharacterized protein n=1 Tax=hydrocarbon metagenome TaxID=938273 RepID=A0A0W8FYK5_9ZZZZ